jgi:hypothetical protein
MARRRLQLTILLITTCWLSIASSFLVLSNGCINKRTATDLFLARSPPPKPPNFVPKPLPLLLGGGLFLFMNSVKRQDKEFAQDLLAQSQTVLRADPTVTMELGQGIETGGVYASQSSETASVKQLVLQFQIEGGNAWAQGVAYGIKGGDDDAKIQLVSLKVANMDASLKGTPFDVPIPINDQDIDET